MSVFKTIGAATVGAFMLLGQGALAATVNTTSNVIFLVDESGSMSGEQAFLKNTVIDSLDAGLSTAGVTNRSYGVVGFGGGSRVGNVRPVGGTTLADAATTKTNLGNLTLGGSTEDGYAAIDYALKNLSFTAGAAINFILVTDEDRDNTDSSLNFSNILQRLTDSKILLNAIVRNAYTSGTGSTALGIDDKDLAYVADGSGGYTTETGATVGSGSGTTTADYVDLALQTGGAAWDLSRLRAGGASAQSFASAFIDIKVAEIISQPPSTPVVPLPAGLPLLIGGLGMLGVLRARRNRAAA